MHCRYFVLAFFILLQRAILTTAAPPPTLIDLKDALKTSLERNLSIKLSSYTSAEKEGSLIKARGEFDPTLKLSYSIDRKITPSSTSLDGVSAGSPSKSRDTLVNASIKQKFKWGTELEVPYKYTVGESNSAFRRFNTTHQSQLGFKFSQPVFESFTPSYFSKSLEAASFDWAIAQAEHQEKIIMTTVKTLDLYWDTLKEREGLKIKELSYDSAKKNYTFVKAKNALGKSSPIDLIEADSTVQKQFEAVLSAKSSYLNKKEELAVQIYGDPTINIELTEPVVAVKPFKPEMGLFWIIKQAQQERSESKRSVDAIGKAELEKSAAAVDRLPDLKLTTEITFKGLDDDFSEANREVLNRNFTSWIASLTLEQPLSMYASRGSYRVKELKLDQEHIKQQQNQRDISLEVRKYMRQINTEWQRIIALKKAVQADSEKYNGQLLRFKSGKISNYELSHSLEDKMGTELELLEAHIAYHKAVFQFSKAQGRLFQDLVR